MNLFSSFRCALVALLMLFALACNGPGGGRFDPGLVASVTVGADTPASRPPALTRYDGNLFVAWADARAEAALFWRDSDPRAYAVAPRVVAGGRVVARVNDPKIAWEGNPGDPLPVQVLPLFSPEEIQNWGLVFALNTEP
jgi:hypothetical protein